MTATEILEQVRSATDRRAVIEALRPALRGTTRERIHLRAALATLLVQDARTEDHALIRALVEAEIERASTRGGGCGDPLYALCFLLYERGDFEDVFLLYEAKFVDMDTGFQIDGRMLTLHADRGELMKFVEARIAGEPALARRASRLRNALEWAFRDAAERSHEEYCASMRQYFDGNLIEGAVDPSDY